MRRTVFSGDKGFTLIELTVALTVLILVLAIAYPVLGLFSRSSSSQLKESAQRTDIRSAASYLTNDIRYSKSVTASGLTLTLMNKNNEVVKYYLTGPDASGNTCLVRERGSILKFQDIRKANFKLNNNNDNLVEISLVTDTANNKHVDFKINRWLSLFAADWQNMQTPQQPPLRIYSAFQFCMINGGGQLIANDAMFFLAGTGTQTYTIDGAKIIRAKTISVDKDLELTGSSQVGNVEGNSDIFVQGKLTMNGYASVATAEQICVNGSLDLENGLFGNENTEVYIDGDALLKGGGVLKGKKIFINGNVTMDSSGILGDADSEIYVKGSIKWIGDARVVGKTIYVTKDIGFNSGYFGNSNSGDSKSNIYVGGNVNVTGTYGDIYGVLSYMGTYTKTHDWLSISATMNKVTGINFPAFVMPQQAPVPAPVPPAALPSFRSDEWYAAKGYTSDPKPCSGMKYYGGNIVISPSGDGNSKSNPYNPVRIASKGNIDLQNNVHAVGILYAPYGTVTISGSSTFKGIIVSKNIDLSTSEPIYIITKDDPQYSELITDLPFN